MMNCIVDEFHVPHWAAFDFVRAFCKKHLVKRIEITPGEEEDFKLLIFHEGRRVTC